MPLKMGTKSPRSTFYLQVSDLVKIRETSLAVEVFQYELGLANSSTKSWEYTV